MNEQSLRIGFISTRLAGTDGVSLESAKWSEILTDLGHTCFYFAGECDRPAERSMVVPEAHFEHPRVLAMHVDLFDNFQRSAETSDAVQALRSDLKGHLQQFARQYQLDLLVVENALSIPVNIPLGLALTELITETGIATIAHHHDFRWERPRFLVTSASDYLNAAFPPHIPQIHHVVINSYAARQLAYRTGLRSTIVPNVMDYEHPPVEHDGYAAALRQALGVADEEKLLLQPTRVVPRKRIECAIELAHWLDRPVALVITHNSGDEGDRYLDYLTLLADALDVKLIYKPECFNHHRGTTTDGRPIFALADAYRHADLVTYPSRVEGFGNAFLEAVYYQCPLVMSSYEIFKLDIEPKGFDVISFDEFVTMDAVQQCNRLLDDPQRVERMTTRNYELAKEYFSFARLRTLLQMMVNQSMGGMF